MRAIRDNIATIVCGMAVIAIIAASVVLCWGGGATHSGTLVANIHDADGNVRRLPLDQDARLEIVTSRGTNTVVVADGAAHMEEANCPTGDCLRQKPISHPGEQIICLPHELWVEITSDSDDADAGSLDVDAVTWEDEPDVDLVAR